MTTEILSWLHDILKAIDEIDAFIIGIDLFEDFRDDLKTKRAVERNIEIIGEAMNRILKVDPNINISNTKQIVGARNRIIHGYDNVSDQILWGIIHHSLPILKAEVNSLLKTAR
ncbi:MAG: HepT-like ribonuclease domain-containing protein [Bacteroidota bacterium]